MGLRMQEGLVKCEPVLLEPIVHMILSIPTDFTSKVLRLVSGRRGQVLGYDAKADWQNWDEVTCLLPQAEMHDLIVELRSLTMGVGVFHWQPDHSQEVPDKLSQQVLSKVANGDANGSSNGRSRDR